MSIRKAVLMGVAAFALGLIGSLNSAHAQGSQAPFTIRRPPDGAVVKEKQRIEIPRASVAQGSVVAFFVDDKFVVALAAPDLTDPKAPKGPFTWIWDTKTSGIDGGLIPDGEHIIRAELFVPAGGESSGAMNKSATSEVKVRVANKISDSGNALYLRYKFRDGENLLYSRDGKALVVSALSGLEATDDMELASAVGKLQLGIEDVQPDVSLVRNKLTSLTINQNGQETSLAPQQLSASMYQELDRLGHIRYETGTSTGLAEFTALGLPVNNTLELPLLPTNRVAVGDTWTTPNQRLDIPGLPPADQPRVTLTNKLDGLEWEGGYPTAKIHQTFKGGTKDLMFGSIDVSSPSVEFDRVIYVAYKAGRLVKTVRTLTIAGRTTTQLGSPTPSAGGAGPMMGGAMGSGYPGQTMGRGGYPGMSGAPGMPMMGGSSMPPGMGSYPGGRGGYPGMSGSGGYPGMPGGGYPGMQGGGRGRGGRRAGGMMGSMGMSGAPPGYGGYQGNRGSGFPGSTGSPAGSAMGNRGTVLPQETDKPVTLKAVTTTELLH